MEVKKNIINNSRNCKISLEGYYVNKQPICGSLKKNKNTCVEGS